MSVKPQLLVDTSLTPIRLQLIEKGEGGRTVVRGEFARGDHATENKRFYPTKIWEGQIKRLGKAMEDRRMYGELDHPVDGRTSLQRVSHIVTTMGVKGGIVVGEAEILPTDTGKQLETLLKSGCKVGVSSRGYGTTKPNDDGVDVVQEDYKLVTFDFVADPADSTAYPEVFFEGVEIPGAEIMGENADDTDIRKHADEDAKKAAAWAKKLEDEKAGKTDDSSNLADELLAKLSEMRSEIQDEVRGELLSDPNVAGARTVVEKIKDLLRPFVLPEDAESVVREKDEEIATLKKTIAEQELRLKEQEDDIERLGAVAKEAGYKFFLERHLNGDPDAEFIRTLIGDVKEYADSKELKARVESIRGELQKKRDADKATEEKIAAEVAKAQELAQATADEAAKKVQKAEAAAEKLAEANKAMALRLYSEKQLRNNPNSAKIRSLVEQANPNSMDDVDKLIEEFSPAEPHDEEEAGDIRSRIRRRIKSQTVEHDALEEETREPRRGERQIHGVDVGELRRLSNIR
jgi:hypothetical protein